MDDDDIGQNWNVSRLPTRQPLTIPRARLRDPADIPPREWLYGTRLIRRFVTVLVAPGGTGKSMFAIGCSMALVSGKDILGEHVHHRVNSAIFNLEDPLDEIDRRIAAMQIRHGITNAELDGLFVFSAREGRRLTIAEMSSDGYEILYPDRDPLIEAMLSLNIGHIVIDPFIKSHSLEENSNPHMDAAATAWAEVGEATGAAIDLIHHTRKGATTDIEAARGGKALTDAARVGQVMTAMSEEEAAKLGVPIGERWRHVRLDDAKTNMSPRAHQARWFRLEMVELGNRTVDYPKGDNVAAIAVWEPPELWRNMSPVQLNGILDLIEQGPGLGVLYSASNRAKGRAGDRWVGNLIMAQLDLNETQAKQVIDAWMDTGLLWKDEYDDPEQRRKRECVRVNPSKRPS